MDQFSEAAGVADTNDSERMMMKQMLLDQSQQSHQVIMFQTEDTTASIATKDFLDQEEDID